jgi:hypothetical protein
MKINVNDKVLISSNDEVIGAYNGEVATVKRIYPDVTPPIAYVEIEADLVARTLGLKVPIADLVLIREEPKSEIPGGAREITKEDFDAALKTVTLPTNHPAGIIKSNPMASFLGGMVGAIAGEEIKSEIFGDHDVVVITEEQLIEKIWNGCSPIKISEAFGGKKSAKESVLMSLSAMMTLQNVPGVLFGEDGK